MNLCWTGVENWKIGFVWFTLVRVCRMKEKYETKQTLHRWCAGVFDMHVMDMSKNY